MPPGSLLVHQPGAGPGSRRVCLGFVLGVFRAQLRVEGLKYSEILRIRSVEG